MYVLAIVALILVVDALSVVTLALGILQPLEVALTGTILGAMLAFPLLRLQTMER